MKILFVLLTLSLTSLLYSQEKPYVSNELLVQLKVESTAHDFLKSSGLEYIGLKPQKLLSKNMNIYLFSFEDNLFTHDELLHIIRANEHVSNAQNNHFIQERETIPTDPGFTNQWHHKNTGQTGGTLDNDIDTPDAWDITTGGTTQFGDEIVVCVLEGNGANMNHPDINDNIYVNANEIPGNGIDDDGNGYIDDINGWNIGSNSDSHNSGNHGTQVMGMIGAEANNTIGTVGVNHNIKMMLVSGFSTSEAGVIAAYDYPLTQRKLYNSSNGTNGAFVVVTNASWGIDGANPNNYPLWCNYYDTLGIHGILNAGATTNSNFNVDTGGDMPTACGSPYMISVTASNHNDQRTFSGYGQTTIDLAAPGEDVYLPSGSQSYGTTSGTSFATPCVAGAIALAYSAPCVSLATLFTNDPQGGADYIRQQLLNTVDIVPSLATDCVTGGRMNVNSFINSIMNGCSNSGCIAPYQVNDNEDSVDTYTISWGGTATEYYLYTRLSGATIWDSVLVNANTFQLTNLSYCSLYEYKLAAVCGNGLSNYTPINTIETDGCCENPSLNFIDNTSSSMDFSWNSILVGTSYNLRYAESGTGIWTTINNANSPHTINGLDECIEYDIQIQTVCADSSEDYSISIFGETSGCGACKDLEYCSVSGGNTQYEFISNVNIGPLTNSSGDDGGYISFENNAVEFVLGADYQASITPTFTGNEYTDKFYIWIDLNHNGTFESSELLFEETGNQTVTDTISIPTTATVGLTRMRVQLFGSTGTGDACRDNPYWGETEDYCIVIKSDESGGVGLFENDLSTIQIYPNPTNGIFTINGISKEANVCITNAEGKEIENFISNEMDLVDLTNEARGIYFISITTAKSSKTFRVVKN
ncbi:MAG: S8 family serine peptidase [Lishizhenia sp.]